MKRAQKKKVKAVIQTGCLISDNFVQFIGGQCKRCVVGELLHAVGKPDEELEEMNGESVAQFKHDPFLAKVEAEFGLTLHQLAALESANDACGDVIERRGRLSEKVDSFPTDDPGEDW